jgi:hypothetical protein
MVAIEIVVGLKQYVWLTNEKGIYGKILIPGAAV